MRSIFIVIALVLFSSNLFADIISDYGSNVIKVSMAQNGGVGYEYCQPIQGCSQIGAKQYYNIADLMNLVDSEKRDPVISLATIPAGIVVGGAAGTFIPPAIYYASGRTGIFIPVLTALVGAVAGAATHVLVALDQRKDIEILMLDGSDIYVKNNRQVFRAKKRIEKLLKKIDSEK